MRILFYLMFLSAFIYSLTLPLFAQEEEEPVNYFQMEPLDDSLFINVQEALFIDPPDPKAEIVVDVRDANNQTISIKGALYPFLALNPELRARILTYPFKLNLEETVNFGSLYTRVINKLRFEKVLGPAISLSDFSNTWIYKPVHSVSRRRKIWHPDKKRYWAFNWFWNSILRCA